jgi:hypothetical protein
MYHDSAGIRSRPHGEHLALLPELLELATRLDDAGDR